MITKRFVSNLIKTLLVFSLIFAFAAVAQANGDVETPEHPLSQSPEVEKVKPADDRIQVQQALTPLATGGPDLFGYRWNDSQPYSWIDISPTGTDTTLDGDEDLVEISLGFDFPFYEKEYSKIYVSSNGVLTFDTNFGTYSQYLANNLPLPFIDPPQAVVAPYWDDLVIGGSYNSGKVYYQQYSASEFVISYIGISDLARNTLTFQVILHEDGDIVFQYAELNGPVSSATIGIEDHDGIDGLTYLYNSDASSLVGKAVHFTRPDDARRVKVLPIYQDAFAIESKANIELSVYNSGDLGSDAFDLRIQNSNSAWDIKLFDQAGNLITKDDNINGHVETPLLNAGDVYTITVNFSAPTDAEVGSTTVVNLTATSMADPTSTWTTRMQSSVPASFAQVLKDAGDIALRVISRYHERQVTVFPLYTGSRIGVDIIEEGKYFAFWERNGKRYEIDRFVDWTDIEQATVNGFGLKLSPVGKVTDNSILATYIQDVNDNDPVAAVSSDGKIGLVWIRNIERYADSENNYNVYMAVLDASDPGTFIKAPFSITQNFQWDDDLKLDIPEYSSPRITALPNNKFFVTWEDQRLQSGGSESNIGFAIFDSNGNQVLSPRNYGGLTSVPGDTLYKSPLPYGLADNNIILGYTSYDVTTKITRPGFAVINTSGASVEDPKLLPGVEGQYPVIVQLTNGTIFFAWTKTETVNDAIVSSNIAYVTIDPNTYDASAHTVLVPPDGLNGDYASLTRDENNNVVITWLDIELERILYYALIDASGSIVTPAMKYYEVEFGKSLLVNQSGKGNTIYTPVFGTFLPKVVK
jgi:hypothetical protein